MSMLKKLEDQLSCPICLDSYTNPKQLQCHHVYCQQCLVKLVVRDQQGLLSLTCPNCRQVTSIPASGVAGLQPAFLVSQLLEIVEEHKKVIATTENVSTSSNSNRCFGCPEHDRKAMVLYCETCVEVICWECIMKGNKHHSHEYQKLDEAFKKYREEITSLLEPLKEKLMTIEKVLEIFDARQNEISDQRANIETDIHYTINQLQETLEVRRTELINQLDKLTQAKLKSLALQRDQIEITQAQLNSCLFFMSESLMKGNQGEALKMKNTTVRQVKELSFAVKPDMLEPNTEANLIFSALADLKAQCQKYGKIEMCAAGPPDPSKCKLTGKKLDTAAVGEKYTAFLQILNADGRPCNETKTLISCSLVSNLTHIRERCNIERRRPSQYEISCQPTIKGRHKLLIKVVGQHIRGSPFLVNVPSPVEQITRSFSLARNVVKEATGIAVNKRGEVVVAEYNGHRISVFSSSLKRVRKFGKHGSQRGQFKFPYGVAVDSRKNILVADKDNHRIQKFSAKGDFLTAVGTEGSGPLQFHNPVGIAVSASNDRVYVVDNTNCHIQILNPDLSYYGTFGKKGSGEGQFYSPLHIACDTTGNVYVADFGNHCIQVSTAEGEFLRMFGRLGEGRGELNGPFGVAIDSSDRVYVSEYWNHRVSVFTSRGQFVTSFGSVGERPGQFYHPQGLAVDSSGVVYVCEQNSDGVKLY